MNIKLTLAEALQFSANWLAQRHRMKIEDVSLEIDVPNTNWPGQSTQATQTPPPPVRPAIDFYGGDYSLKRKNVADANKLFLIKMIRAAMADVRQGHVLKNKEGNILIAGEGGSIGVRVDKMYDLGTTKVWVERHLSEESNNP